MRPWIWKTTAVVAIFIVIAMGWWLQTRVRPPADWRQFQKVQIGEREFEMVTSTTAQQIQQGLSDRRDIGADGMVFVLPLTTRPTFWMYHMQFPLDFIWVRDEKVVDLHENIPPPGVNEKPQVIQPQESVSVVIEVPAGFIRQYSIKKGDTVQMVGSVAERMWYSNTSDTQKKE